MKAFTSTLVIWGIAGVFGCHSAPERPVATKSSSSPANSNGQVYEVSLPAQACNGQGTVWSLQDQTIEWSATKGDQEEPVVGVIKAAGWLALNSQANMQIFFSSASLDSASQLRDDRIKEYILGYLETEELLVEITNLADIQSELEAISSQATQINFEGNLEIYGQNLNVIIPSEVWLERGALKIKSLQGALIDLTQSSFMNAKIKDLLDIAEVTTMSETVPLSFEISFEEACES
ncbi:MAG: hypothetical protein ACOH5I_17290 [Oligoflexus sp.]